MKIKYTVWEHVRVKRRKTIRTTNGEIEWNGDWNNDDHASIRVAIAAENPGKAIMGYCPADKWGEFTHRMNTDNAGLNLV